MERGLALYHGDALDVLRTFRDESVHAAITSPPYYGLRDYGTGTWEGGDPDCDHRPPPAAPRSSRPDPHGFGTRSDLAAQDQGTRAYRTSCPRCGARRVDRQVGLEETPEEYVLRLVEVFRELRRVLRSDGVFWLNVSDSYSSGGRRGHGTKVGAKQATNRASATGADHVRPSDGAFKPKDLIPVSWMLAIALQRDGWYLRAPVIWHKPNAMPTSARDRPGLAHEYLFMLARSPRYFFDMEAVKQPHTSTRWGGKTITQPPDTKYAEATTSGFAGAAEALSRPGREWDAYPEGGKNLRTVWTIPTKPYKGAHFAAFPPTLVETCVAATTSERGVCPECSSPYVRQLEKHATGRVHQEGVVYTPTGWESSCDHRLDPVPAVVLDPFVGSGTTAMQCAKMGRRAVGIDLSEEYLGMALQRFKEGK